MNSKKLVRRNDLSILHLKSFSLSSCIDHLEIIALLGPKFDIMCISGSRLSKNDSLATNIDIIGYNIEHTPTESYTGGSLIYISQDLCYTVCQLQRE